LLKIGRDGRGLRGQSRLIRHGKQMLARSRKDFFNAREDFLADPNPQERRIVIGLIFPPTTPLFFKERLKLAATQVEQRADERAMKGQNPSAVRVGCPCKHSPKESFKAIVGLMSCQNLSTRILLEPLIKRFLANLPRVIFPGGRIVLRGRLRAVHVQRNLEFLRKRLNKGFVPVRGTRPPPVIHVEDFKPGTGGDNPAAVLCQKKKECRRVEPARTRKHSRRCEREI
jgi:hypothetical protein